MGPPHSKECEGALRTSLALCETLGFPIGSHKVEGPATSLGILINTEVGVLRLPADKLARLQDLIMQWQGKRASTKRDLLSLIGHLSHACRVVKSGRTFLRRMIDLSATPKELHHRVRLNKGFQSGGQRFSRAGTGFPCLVEFFASSHRRRWHQMHQVVGAVGRTTTQVPGFTGIVGPNSHHYKGAAANCGSMCSVGPVVAREDSMLLV
jgi:hypothetical protein